MNGVGLLILVLVVMGAVVANLRTTASAHEAMKIARRLEGQE